MADVFVSYARSDKARIAPLVAAIEAAGWSVWWDPEVIPGQEFDRLIAAELKIAAAVLVIWTPTSVESRWVRGEARDAADRGILVPVRFEHATLPIDVRALHTIDLDDAAIDAPGKQIQDLLHAIEALVARQRGPRSAPAIAASPPIRTVATPVARTTICVLPFANMSGDAEQEYFSDGITEDIITDLSKVSALAVISRNSAFMYKGKHVDLPKVARELGVTHVLEGSVRKAGSRVRITAQLVNGSSNDHVWAERYDRELSDIFAVQEEISRQIVATLRVKLLAADAARLKRRGTKDAAAYDIYLRGRQLLNKEKEDEHRAAVEMFREAIRLDPEFADAHAGLADVLTQLLRKRCTITGISNTDVVATSQRAIDLAPDLADAYVARGNALQLTGELDEAKRSFERAIALDPRHFHAHYWFAKYWVARGEHALAAQHYEHAFEIQPDDYRPITLALQEYQAIKDRTREQSALQRSWQALERHLTIDPDDSYASDHAAGVLMLLGRREEANRLLDRALALRPDDYGTLYTAACTASLGGEFERALDFLDRAVGTGRGHREWILNDNDLAPLHELPRFKEIVARLAESSTAR